MRPVPILAATAATGALVALSYVAASRLSTSDAPRASPSATEATTTARAVPEQASIETTPVAKPAVAAAPVRPQIAATAPAAKAASKVRPAASRASKPRKSATSQAESIASAEPSQSAEAGVGPDTTPEPATRAAAQTTPVQAIAHQDVAVAKPQPSAAQRPADSRWIKQLSGQDAKVNVLVVEGGQAAPCPIIESGTCIRVPAPKDLSLVGVVVKTQRLAETPTAPLDGRVSRGHYGEFTPALYVE